MATYAKSNALRAKPFLMGLSNMLPSGTNKDIMRMVILKYSLQTFAYFCLIGLNMNNFKVDKIKVL